MSKEAGKGFPVCLGCGYCCLKVQCQISIREYGVRKICPALKWNGVRHICLLAIKYKNELAINAGCSSSLFNLWRKEIKDRIGECAMGRKPTTGKYKTREELIKNVLWFYYEGGQSISQAGRTCGISESSASYIVSMNSSNRIGEKNEG